MKKIVCIALSLILVLALLAGCGSSSSQGGEKGDAEISGTDGPGDGQQGEAPPERPDGEGGPEGTPPGMPEGEGGPDGAPPEGAPGGSSEDIDYTGSAVITSAASESGKTYSSQTSDESALIISASEDVKISEPSVTKTGDSDGGDDCSFYGLNAAVLVKGGGTATIEGGTITSSASGANGVFCYGGNGDGTTVIIRNTKISTTGSGSGGIMTTGGGRTFAYDLDVETSGGSSAPIRTDRGGGTVTAQGGRFVSGGLGSPAVYSTADVSVSGAELISNLSEGICIEGRNSVTLTDCSLDANNTACNGRARFYDTVMLYQSMSGDAGIGTSSFTMKGGSITSRNGHVFHVTNTDAVISLDDVEIDNKDYSNILLSICGDGWSGAGNSAVLKASDQLLSGGVLVGSDSSLELILTDGSVFEGYVSGSITDAFGSSVSSEAGTVSVSLEDGCVWNLTADSCISEFSGDAGGVNLNGFTLYVGGAPFEGAN